VHRRANLEELLGDLGRRVFRHPRLACTEATLTRHLHAASEVEALDTQVRRARRQHWRDSHAGRYGGRAADPGGKFEQMRRSLKAARGRLEQSPCAGCPHLSEHRAHRRDTLETEETLRQRLANVGKLTREDALRLGAVGPTARASGVDRDTRRDDPYGAYAEISFKVVTDDHCDVYGRTLVRLGELMESYSIIRQLVKNMPEGPVLVKAPRRIPEGEAVSRYEAPRGEDVHYVRGNGTERPERVKVRAPTLANTQAVAKMLEDGYLADLPIVIAAIDPCFSCTDRMIGIKYRCKW